MDNIKYNKEGDELVIRIDLTKNFGTSSTGKSAVVANSHGHSTLPDMGGLRLNLYLSTPVEKSEK